MKGIALLQGEIITKMYTENFLKSSYPEPAGQFHSNLA
jgi:hypothetical protein